MIKFGVLIDTLEKKATLSNLKEKNDKKFDDEMEKVAKDLSDISKKP